jgi:hypothetical protein
MSVLMKIKRDAVKFSRPLMVSVSGHDVKRERKRVTRELEDIFWRSATR